MTDAKPRKLSHYFTASRRKGRADLPLMSVTMHNGLVRRDELDRKMDSALTPEEHLLVEPNDIAYNTMRMWQGCFGLADEAANVSPAYVVMRPKDTVDPRFAAHWFKSELGLYMLWAYSYGLTEDRLRLYGDEFLQIPVLWPPKPAQAKIAMMLDACDDMIASSTKLASAKAQELEAVRQKLLLPIGRDTVRLSQIAKVNPRTDPQSPQALVTFLAMEDVSDKGSVLRRRSVTRGDLGNGYTAFQDGDVLVAKITPCFENGKGALVSGLHNGVGFGSTEFHVLRAKGDTNPSFLAHHVQTPRFRRAGEQQMSGSAGQKRVPKEFIEDYRVPCLSADEQGRAVAILDAASDEAQGYADLAELLRRQKRGLMQALFTSEWQAPKSIDRLMPGAAAATLASEASVA